MGARSITSHVCGDRPAGLEGDLRTFTVTFVETKTEYFPQEVGISPALFVAIKPSVLRETSGHFQKCLWGPKQSNYDDFLTLTKCFSTASGYVETENVH